MEKEGMNRKHVCMFLSLFLLSQFHANLVILRGGKEMMAFTNRDRALFQISGKNGEIKQAGI